MTNTTATEVISKVADKTSSELIYFFIILAVVFLAVSIPMTSVYLKNAREKRKQQVEKEALLAKQQLEKEALQAKRDEMFMGVISHNTEVNVQLKTLLETNNNNCTQCKYEHQEKMDVAIHEIGRHNDKLVEVITLLDQKQIIP